VAAGEIPAANPFRILVGGGKGQGDEEKAKVVHGRLDNALGSPWEESSKSFVFGMGRGGEG
jgi:hypothetical protein